VEWIRVTLHLYRRVFERAAALALRNWPVLLTVFAYLAILRIGGLFALGLGIFGGFLLTLVWAACAGSLLYLVEMIVRTSKVSLDDFRRSFGVYLWDVVGVAFILWIVFRFATPALLAMPQGFLVLLFAQITVFILFNAVPELIYLGHHSSLALLSESYAFISANWIEWFPATLVAVALLFALSSIPLSGPSSYLQTAASALLIYFTMVMRGLLFIELSGSTYRSRAFKYRTGA
jgi:hypothetical protein